MKNIIAMLFVSVISFLGISCKSDDVSSFEVTVSETKQEVADVIADADSKVASVNAAEWRNWYDYGFVGREYTVEAFQYGSAYYQPLYFFGNHPLDIIDRIGY